MRLAAPAIGLVVGLAVLGLRAGGLLLPLEFVAYDAFLGFRAASQEPDPRITIVTLTEADIQRFGYPVPDFVLAAAIQGVLDAGAVAVGVDIYRDREVGEGEALLRRAASDSRVVLIEKVGDTHSEGVSAPSYAGPEQTGFSDVVRDPDDVVRRGLLYLWDADDAPHVAMALQLALRFLTPRGVVLGPDPDHEGQVLLGETTIPYFQADQGAYRRVDDSGYQFLLDYQGAPHPFDKLAFADAVSGDFDPKQVEGRVALIGTEATSVKDHFSTPIHFPGMQGRSIYGVEIHAHAVSQLLRLGLDGAEVIRTPAPAADRLWILAWSLAGALLGIRIRRPTVLIATVVAFAGILLGVGIGAFFAGWWVATVSPGVGALGAAVVSMSFATREERAERDLIMQLFARNVGQTVADRLWDQRDQFMEAGRPRSQRLTLTVLMSDLKGFTAAAERMEASELMDWMNDYVAAMAQLVEDYGGAVDDYAGDGIKANFGAPVPRTTQQEIAADARNAVSCALAMGQEMEELNARWKKQGLPTAKVRVGVYTGPAVVGSLGSKQRLKFTSMGNTVNTAARLEQFDKDGFGNQPGDGVCRVLIGDSTMKLVEGRFEVEPAGEQKLRGKSETLRVYRVTARAGEHAPTPETAA